jgi:hypothetical protein
MSNASPSLRFKVREDADARPRPVNERRAISGAAG